MAPQVTQFQKQSILPPEKLFKSISTNPDVIYQNAIDNVENVQLIGKRGEGSYMVINLVGGGTKLMKIDKIDPAEKVFAYSIVGGTDFDAASTEKISYQTRVRADPHGGGSIADISVVHHTLPNLRGYVPALPTETQGFDVFDAVEKYLEE